MTYRAASYGGIAVVAAKTDKGIIRAIQYPSYPHYHRRSTFGHDLIDAIITQVGALNLAEVEWTGYYYPTEPYYLYDLPGSRIERDIQSGVWLFPWVRAPGAGKYPIAQGISDHKNPIKLADL